MQAFVNMRVTSAFSAAFVLAALLCLTRSVAGVSLEPRQRLCNTMKTAQQLKQKKKKQKDMI